MATYTERITDIIAGGVDRLITPFESPSVSAERDVKRREKQATLVGLEVAAIGAMAACDKKASDKALDRENHYRALAKEALAAGNEDDARALIAESIRWHDEADRRYADHMEALASTSELTELLDDMRSEISLSNATAKYVDAELVKARAYEHAGKVVGRIPSYEACDMRRAQLEEKADFKYNKARITYTLKSPGMSPVRVIEKKYTDANRNARIDAVLAELTEDGR